MRFTLGNKEYKISDDRYLSRDLPNGDWTQISELAYSDALHQYNELKNSQ